MTPSDAVWLSTEAVAEYEQLAHRIESLSAERVALERQLHSGDFERDLPARLSRVKIDLDTACAIARRGRDVARARHENKRLRELLAAGV